LIYRKKPMTPDERMPLFLALASLPIGVAWYYLHEDIATRMDSSPLVVAASLAVFGVVMWFSDSMSRKNKNMYDWNARDSLIVGVAGIASFVPGCGRQAAMMTGSLFRNFSREASAKFALFAALPALVGSAAVRLRDLHFGTPFPVTEMPELSWMSFYVALIVAFLSSLLAVSAFMKHIARGGMGQYAAWRVLVGAAIIGLYFYRGHSGG
jgi:undecaprenyl-diphosphatase